MMARAPVLAAGGIVLRRGTTPLIAVVRQRKRNEWVLPKGKLDDGETPKVAAHREVLEETGHDVTMHEFLGTLVYQSGGRMKVVHFWRMEADGGPVRKLMNDIKAVDWLPLDDALGRLSREYERHFLSHVGPIALQAAGIAPPTEEPPPPLAVDDVDAAMQTLSPAEAASVEELRHGLLQKVRAWLRGEA
jgi:8-oxo-dGTP diphosphatase